MSKDQFPLQDRVSAAKRLLVNAEEAGEPLPPEQRSNLVEAVEFLEQVEQFFRGGEYE